MVCLRILAPSGLGRGGEFTQPSLNLLAKYCTHEMMFFRTRFDWELRLESSLLPKKFNLRPSDGRSVLEYAREAASFGTWKSVQGRNRQRRPPRPSEVANWIPLLFEHTSNYAEGREDQQERNGPTDSRR